MKNWIKDYLTFSKRDRIGIISLLFLILLIYFLPLYFAHNQPIASIKQDSDLLKALQTQIVQTKDSPSTKWSGSGPRLGAVRQYETSLEKPLLFAFDPNTLPRGGWQKLGLQDKTINTLIHYREKGGRFYKPQDLQKIWGLPPGFYERVKSFIVIPGIKNRSLAGTNYPRKQKKSLDLDINQADTTAFIALPGIGSRLAARIINFREKLGGFYDVQQIKETYGLPDSTFQMIQPLLHLNEYKLKKVNINTASAQDLKGHPYIKWNIANAIVAYRTQHGSFSQLDELKKISLISEAYFNKIVPYLTIQ